jgi:hypothetical protein
MKVATNIRLEEEIVERLRELEMKSHIRFAKHVEIALTDYLAKKEPIRIEEGRRMDANVFGV